MGVITGDIINFKSTDHLFSRIKRRLKKFTTVNLIDENNFPELTAHVLETLGISAYKEEEVLIKIKDRKACLPNNFKELHAAYLCQDTPEASQKHLQNVSVFEYEISDTVYSKRDGCEIECESPDKLMERIVFKQFVNDRYIEHTYKRPILLSLSPNVKAKCTDDCLNLMSTSPYEITIDDNIIYTTFDEGRIYLKYYGFPLDEEGMPMIPDIIQVEKAVEAYIMWQLFMDFYLTDDIPNAGQKMQLLQVEYDKAMAEARYILKLPRFSSMVNLMKTNKGLNSLQFFSQIDRKHV